MKTLAIFDLDGTLLNTIADLGAAANAALRACGFPEHAPETYPRLVGNGVSKLIERSLPEEARRPQVIEEMRRHFMAHYDEHCTDITAPYPGVRELLSALSKFGVALAVTSNKYQSATDRIIAHFFPEFEWVAVEGQREGVPLKPDPSIVFAVLTAHPTAKADVLYIGDSGVDMETARRACIDSVGVTWGFRPRAELEAYQALHIVDRPVEIIQLLKN